MPMRMCFHNRNYLLAFLFVLVTTGICNLPVVAEQVQKVSYEPKVVTLTGTIVTQVFPGAPNYESVAKGDKPEKAWILHLHTPIQLDAAKNAAKNNNDAEKNVREVQLVLGFDVKNSNADPDKTAKSQYKIWEPLTHKGITTLATGKLFHSQTGHHHTRILMTVQDLQRKK